MHPRLAAAGRRLRRVETVVFALLLLILGKAYFGNEDMGKDPHSPRGDGKYRPVLARGDGHMIFLMLRSMVLDGDLDFGNDLDRFGDPWKQPRTETGYRDVPHPIGPALIWTPVFALAHGVSRVANAFGADIPSHGYTLFHQRCLYTTSVLFAFGAVLLGWLVVRRRLGVRWPPLYAAAAVLLGTSLTYYATFMPGYAHAMDAFTCAAFLGYWALTYGETRWKRSIVLGILLGVAALVRVQELALGVVYAAEIGLRLVRERRAAVKLLAHGAAALGVALVVFTPQLVAWKVVYGEWLHHQNGPHYVRFAHAQVAELLWSSRNGWFSTTPLAYAGTIGLLVAPRRFRAIAWTLFAALALQVYLNASIYDWWGSASYGARRLCSMTLPLVVGLACLMTQLARLRLPRVARHALAAVGLGWFALWNWEWVDKLQAGKPAGRGAPGALAYDGIPAWMQDVARPVEERIGNPFALPASAVFAIQHGVPLRRWDFVVGDYWHTPGNDELGGAYRRHRGPWKLTEKRVLRGLGPMKKDGARDVRVTTGRADVFVGLIIADRHELKLPLAADSPTEVRILWNGEQVATWVAGPDWHELLVEVDAHVGQNVLSIDGPAGVKVATPTIGFRIRRP